MSDTAKLPATAPVVPADNATTCEFQVDPVATDLDGGHLRNSWGLNLNVLSPPPAAFVQELYRPLAHQLRKIGAPCLHVYPEQALHISLASPLPFTAAHPFTSLRMYGVLCESWSVALSTIAADLAKLVTPVLRIASMELHKRAVVLRFTDSTGTIEAARQRIAELVAPGSRLHEELTVLTGHRVPDSCWLQIPRIVHMTIARFKAEVPDGPALRAQFDALAADVMHSDAAQIGWRATSLRLVQERVPYMHMPDGVRAHTMQHVDFQGSPWKPADELGARGASALAPA